MSKKPYDALLVEEYEHKGEKRQKFYQCGVMFENDREGWTLTIPPGMSISGRVVILPRKDKTHNTDPDSNG